MKSTRILEMLIAVSACYYECLGYKILVSHLLLSILSYMFLDSINHINIAALSNVLNLIISGQMPIHEILENVD